LRFGAKPQPQRAQCVPIGAKPQEYRPVVFAPAEHGDRFPDQASEHHRLRLVGDVAAPGIVSYGGVGDSGRCP